MIRAALLALLLTACSMETTPEQDAEIIRYANDLRECSEKYQAQGMSREAAVYGPCSVEVPPIAGSCEDPAVTTC